MSRPAIMSLLGIMALCLSLPASHAQSPPPAANRVVSGVVLSAASDQPLEGADVTLQDANGFKPVAETTTDAEGRFSFPNLPDGKFALSASHRGYAYSTYEQHDGPFTAIVTGENQNTTGLVLSLSLLGSIFGTVTEDSGDPVPQAQLRLFRKSSFGDTERVVRAGQTMADAMGNFEFSSLTLGTYFLCASGTPWYRPGGVQMGIAGAGTAFNQQRSPLDVTYPLTCYPETTDSAGAEPIPVKPGDRVQANLTFHPVPALHILFQLPKDDSGRGLAMPQLQQQIFGYSEPVPSGGFVRPNMENEVAPVTVEMGNVPPGQYSVEVPGQDPSKDTSQFGTIQLSSGDVSLDVSSLQPMASVSGKLLDAGGGASPSGCMIELISERGEARSSGPVEADGRFQIRAVPPGEYEVQVAAGGFRWAVTQLQVKGVTVDGPVLKVGSDPIELTVVATRAAGSVSGFVTRNGKPASGVFLLLVPANPDAGRFTWQPNQSDSDGSFTFENVIPGEYTVVAIEQGWTLDWRDRSVIAPYLAGGAKVTMGAHTKAVDLKSPLEPQTIGAPHAP
jgi:5-hydroxyisourate hydrolase-like protein (transthyretin family)